MEELCAIFVDMGTTNTRGWLMRGGQILARTSHGVGVRDTAREGTPVKIRAVLKEIADELRSVVTSESGLCTPLYVAAAGMISSSLGLVEIPHVGAPAGIAEIASSSLWTEFPEVVSLPILLIPGVRCGPANAKLDSIHEMDVMRGEETLCVGLGALRQSMPLVVLNLGSHWKAIQMNAEGAIVSSVTSLSGELIHAAQTQTVLSGSLPRERAKTIAKKWMDAGMKETRRSGLPRALFSVRLLELAGEGTPPDRLSFLIGAFIAADLDALISRGMLLSDIPIVIAGADAWAGAWRDALVSRSFKPIVLTASQTEEAFLTGMRYILERAWHLRAAASS